MDNLIITDYCSDDKKKYHFTKEISKDPLIKNFVTNNIEELIESSKDNDKLYMGPAYIVKKEKNLIGLIRLASLDIDGVLNLHYAVHPNYRKQHYGTEILTETSKYLLKNIAVINRIELFIKDINKGSIRCAENAKFTLNREFCSVKSDCLVKVYSLEKQI